MLTAQDRFIGHDPGNHLAVPGDDERLPLLDIVEEAEKFRFGFGGFYNSHCIDQFN